MKIVAFSATIFLLINVSIKENEVGRRYSSSNYTGNTNINTSNANSVTLTAQWYKPVTYEYNYTGDIQTFTVPSTGKYKLEVWGAQGADSTTDSNSKYGGYGGYSFGVVNLSASSSVYVVVGEKPSLNQVNGAYNGGGNGTSSGTGGGGATHIATRTGVLSSLSSYKSTVLIVAAGGSGATSSYDAKSDGNPGGGYIGSPGNCPYNGGCNNFGVTGGTQTSAGSLSNGTGAGSFGLGGDGTSGTGSGGGGGWYGGGGASNNGSTGGGGSGYIGNSLLLADKGMYMYSKNVNNKSTSTDVILPSCTASTAATTKTTCTTTTGAHLANAANTGNGYAKITYLGTSI